MDLGMRIYLPSDFANCGRPREGIARVSARAQEAGGAKDMQQDGVGDPE